MNVLKLQQSGKWKRKKETDPGVGEVRNHSILRKAFEGRVTIVPHLFTPLCSLRKPIAAEWWFTPLLEPLRLKREAHWSLELQSEFKPV